MKAVGFLLVPCLLLGGTVIRTFEFHPADFVFDRMNGYDVVALPGHYSTTEPGKPSLPLAVYNLVIPPDAEITGVRVVEVATEPLPGVYHIHPSQRPQVLSLPKIPFVEPDAATYASTEQYPPELVRFTPSGCLGGYRLAGLQIVPLRYSPARKQLTLIRRLTLKVEYAEKQHEVLSLSQSQIDLMAQAAGRLVINPEAISQYAPIPRLTDDWLCDLAIITNNSLRTAFQPFADWKTKQGFKTRIITTESIYATYPGRDNQERIRNCVIDYWRNHGLKWLLLGGDDQIVPVRTCRITCEGITENIASDMYYADLQWSWDGNRNNYFGEMGDTVDLFYDIYVGRWCADNAGDVAMYFAKDTMYSKRPDTTYIKKMVLGSTMLFSPFHGKVINRIIAGLFPSGWQFTHLEDPASGQYASAISAGNQLSHVAAHGNQTSFSVMDLSECSGLSNGYRKLNFVNSIACQSGWFDGYECLAEGLTKAANGGCIAAMLNSRYGFGYPPGFGPSEMLDEQFYIDFLAKNNTQFGSLCASSKDYFQTLTMNQEVWRWCVYELNLLGDPTLHLWTQTPRTLTISKPGSVPTGPQTCRITILDGTNPVPKALVCLMKGNETYARGWTNSQGWIDLFINPATTGNLDLTVSAQDFYVHESQIPVTGSSSAPAILFADCRIDDSDGNGRLDPGETADLYLSLTNSGAAPATNVLAKLRPLSSYITLIDSVASFGTITPGATIEGDRFRVTAAQSTPQGHLAEFVAATTANEGTWQPFFTLRIGTPPTPRKLWTDHDLGNMILSVTSVGSIGTLGPYREGSGLKYPRNAGYGSLYFTSLACATDPNYVVDRWYGRPTSTYQTDWRVLDTLQAVLPPIAAQQEYKAVFDDGAHSAPKGLKVTQWSGCLSQSQPGYDDFVIITYNLENTGTNPINGLYVGIMSDFDVNNTTSNAVGTDNSRRLVYMTDNSSTWVGIKLLSPNTAANLSAISHALYVIPSNMMTEAVKDSFLRGAIRLSSGSGANYSCVASAGPFNLAPGGRTRVAFAFVGGTNLSSLQVNADSAQSWFDNRMPVGLTYLRSIIDDAPPGGNGDGILNPGESINLPVWIINRADHPATGVRGILRKTSGDTLTVVTDSIRRFGFVGSGDSAFTGNDGFKLRVSPACTNGYVLPLSLVCIDTLDSAYVSSPGLKVGAPQLVAGGILCWDPRPGGNGNGKLDPGEQAEIAIGLSNTGLGNAQNVVARLKSGDSRFTILDSLGAYGTIRPDSTRFNDPDRFAVLASGTIPRETQIPCTLKVSGTAYQATRVIMIPIGELTAIDPIPDGPRTPPMYYAYDDCDSFYVAHPTYQWVEIRGIGTRLSLSDDQTVTISLPSAFGPWRYYGTNYTQISICSNGFVMPGSFTATAYTNAALPASTLAAPAICANWDDLYPPTGGGVWYYHDAANHRFIVEWDSVAYYSPRESWDKFQIVIMDTTQQTVGGQNSVIVQYQTANNYVSNTVGIQDPTRTIAIQCLFNGSYHRAASQLIAGRAIRYTTDSMVTGIAESPLPRTGSGPELAAFPNPQPARHGTISISFTLPRPGNVRLTMHDITGRCVRTLLNSSLKPDKYLLQWNYQDDYGRTVAPGIYLCRLQTGEATLTEKLVIIE